MAVLMRPVITFLNRLDDELEQPDEDKRVLTRMLERAAYETVPKLSAPQLADEFFYKPPPATQSLHRPQGLGLIDSLLTSKPLSAIWGFVPIKKWASVSSIGISKTSMPPMTKIPSYRRIDYTLRPAKNIERKMIAEACFRLTAFRPVHSYRYVGFGSPYFSDFRLFHRLLGFQTMVNIESQTGDKDRFDFNRPYECISMKYGTASDKLPELTWKNTPTVVWLDYDKGLTADILDDIQWLVANLEVTSLLLVTVRSSPEDFGRQRKKLEAFKAEFGEWLPANIGQRAMTAGRFSGNVAPCHQQCYR